MNLILDTHILIWWLHDVTDQLSKGQRVALTEAQKRRHPLALSAITLWEIAMLLERHARVTRTSPLAMSWWDHSRINPNGAASRHRAPVRS